MTTHQRDWILPAPVPYMDAVTRKMTAITRATAHVTGISVDAMRGPERIDPVFFARAIAIYVTRQQTMASLSQIGRFFGRDHTSALNAIRRVDQMMAGPDFAATVNAVIEMAQAEMMQ